jgi:hypothetical protein
MSDFLSMFHQISMIDYMWNMPYALILFMQYDKSFEYYLDDDKKKEMEELFKIIDLQQKFFK